MPKTAEPVLENDVELEDELLEEEDNDSLDLEDDIDLGEDTEITEITKVTKTKKRKKQTLSSKNEYIFGGADRARFGEAKLKYESGDDVVGFRTWVITFQAEDESIDAVEECFILARSQADAAMRFMSTKGYGCELKFKKSRGNSGPRKIDPQILIFAKSMAGMIFVDEKPNGKQNPNIPQASKDAWETQFGVDGNFSHYLDDNNEWKEPTVK